MSGWIKLHRRLLKHWIFSDAEYLKAWITILMEVNHEDRKILIGSELIECKRGQAAKSLGSWVKLLGRRWSVQKIRTFFLLLKNDGMINTQGTTKTTILTVCNYNTYQDWQQASNMQFNKPATNEQQTNNNKQVIKEC